MIIQCQGRDVHVQESGPVSAPALLFCHSLGASLELWDPQAAFFSKRFRVVRYDLRGHGLSTPGDATEYSLSGLAADALEVLDTLNIDRAHFCGISIGGMIGQELAIHHRDRLLTATLADTFCSVDEEARDAFTQRAAMARNEGMEPLADATMERWFTAEFRRSQPDVVKQVRSGFVETTPAGFGGCCAAIAGINNSHQLADIITPTLLLAGSEDPTSPAEVNQFMHDRIPGSSLHFIEGAAHIANLAAVDEFNRCVAGFIEAT